MPIGTHRRAGDKMIYVVDEWTIPFEEYGLETIECLSKPYIEKVRIGEDIEDADGNSYRVVSISHTQDGNDDYYGLYLFVVDTSYLKSYENFTNGVPL